MTSIKAAAHAAGPCRGLLLRTSGQVQSTTQEQLWTDGHALPSLASHCDAQDGKQLMYKKCVTLSVSSSLSHTIDNLSRERIYPSIIPFSRGVIRGAARRLSATDSVVLGTKKPCARCVLTRRKQFSTSASKGEIIQQCFPDGLFLKCPSELTVCGSRDDVATYLVILLFNHGQQQRQEHRLQRLSSGFRQQGWNHPELEHAAVHAGPDAAEVLEEGRLLQIVPLDHSVQKSDCPQQHILLYANTTSHWTGRSNSRVRDAGLAC